MVADVTSQGELRGYAEVDPAALPAECLDEAGDEPLGIARLLGKGYMAFTVDLAPDGERYQGIVELSGDSAVDLEAFRAFYKNVEGRWPEKTGPIEFSKKR